MYSELTSEAIILLQQMVAIPSFSREEKAVADFLEKYIEIKGYVVSRKDNNLWLMSPGFDSLRPTVLFNSHIDTVKPVAGWTKDPYRPGTNGDKVYGLGSNDAGASVVSLLHAWFELVRKPQPYNLIFSATAEEEISGKNGIESLLTELPAIDFAVVGEPTGMNLAVAEKGLMVLDCNAKGRAGHAARNEGDNAIYNALADVEWFRTFQFPLKSELLGPVKMSVTQIHAGTQHNVVPDSCSFVVDVRSNEFYSNQDILDTVRQYVRSDVKARSIRLSSTATPVNHPVVVKGRQIGRTIFGSPTLSDQSLLPFASVKMGPGDSARSHTADEFILKSEIKAAIEIYIELFDGLLLS